MGGRDATMVLLDENGIRCDGRKIDEPRRIMIKAGGLKNADGSAYIEFGDNKILVGVFGVFLRMLEIGRASCRERV